MRLAALLLLVISLTAGCDGDEPGDSHGWRRLPDAPLAGRTGATVVGIGSQVYVFGGWEFLCPPGADCGGPSEKFADGAVLDLDSEEWQPIADAPFGFTGGSTAVLGGEIYVLPRRELLRYSPQDDTWTRLGRLPRHVGSALVATDHGLLALAGTEEHGSPRDAVYDPASGTWTVLPDDPLPASFDRFAVPDSDRLLLFGSPIPERQDQAVTTKAVAAFDWATGTWTELSPAPAGGFQAWRAGERVFLNPHFSRDGGGLLDLATDTWAPIPDEGSGWDGDAAGVVRADGATYEYAEGWVFDARDDSWFEVPDRGGDAYDEAAAAAGQALVVFGGQSWRGSEGELLSETWVWRPPA